MSASQIRVLTLNCWGLKFVSKNRNERVAAIARALSDADHDIVALQELWVFSDYEHVRDSVSNKLPYAKFFYSGALGAGLVIFSRWPIVASSVYPYALNGAPTDVIAGDWFVGKAAASVVIAHPILGQVQIFNTHLFAKGGEGGPEHHRAHRLVNSWEFAKLVRTAAELGRYVIAAGDFNSVPTSLPMEIIRDHTGLTDAWAVSHPNAPASTTNALEAIHKFGVTADSPLNSYSAGKPLEPYARKFMGKRLDYVFFRHPPPSTTSDVLPTLTCTQSRVAFTDKVPGADFSYSDHFGLEATLEIQQGSADATDAIPPSTQLSAAAITKTIQALTACYRFSRTRGRNELSVFGLCVLTLFGLIIGSAWLPHSWINPIFVLFTVFVAWLGTTMLYEGFLYGRWELNALMNVIEELEIHRKSVHDTPESSRGVLDAGEDGYAFSP
ncbi:hypothetical protein PLICRDRAFT_87974 [Plicaturopsis crispa FD-325 SS-3]|nr:hypothetical protein PLICRDRAFT_87974 [Plicaturopsis crispa FD-325 SS-3]